MNSTVEQILEKPIKLADQVIEAADKASYCKQECTQLKSITEKLAALLRQAARESSRLHQRPARRIIQDTEQVLYKALLLVNSPVKALLKRVFPTIIPFSKVHFLLQDSIGNVSWLLGVFVGGSKYPALDKPSIAVKEPILCRIWEHIAILHTGSQEKRSDAAAFLVSLAGNNHCYGKLIVEEGGVSPLLNLLQEGNTEEQEKAARAIGLLGNDPGSVEHIIHVDVCSVFAKILENGTLRVQAVVAWVVSKLAESYPKCQDLFAKHNIIKLLVDHLAYLTIENHTKYLTDCMEPSVFHSTLEMKEMVTLALWLLAKGNSAICHAIAESRALLCLAVLLETESVNVQYNTAMVVMEITTLAEKNADSRESSPPPFKAILNQALRLIKTGDSKLLIPCIKTIGNLARATTETRMIGPLVRLIHMRDTTAEVCMEALIALTKYACRENDFHMDYSKEIIRAVEAEHLIDLVYLPHNEKLAKVKVLRVLEWASMDFSNPPDPFVEELLRESKIRLELSSKIF